jgi:hypothetical protein
MSFTLPTPLTTGAGATASRSRSPIGAASLHSTYRSTGQWLVVAMLFYTNKVLWYDLRIILESLRGDSFRSILAVQGVLLMPFIAASLLGGVRLLARSRIVMLFPLMVVYGLAVNAIHGVEYPMFALQDLFKFMFLPTGFVLAWLSPPATVDRVLKFLAHAILAFLVIKILLFIAYYHSQYRLYYGGVLDVFPFCYFFANFCSGRKSARTKNGILAASSLVLVALGQKRTVFIIAVSAICYLMFRSRQTVGKNLAVYVATISIAAAVIGFRQPLAELAGVHFERIVQARFDTTLGEDSARFREIVLVWELHRGSSWSARWFGFGHGAAFDDEVPDVHGETLTHSVHFTPAAMLLRYGYVGVAFFVLVAAGVLFAPERTKSTWLTATDVLVMKSFALTAVLGSLVLYGLVDDMLVGVFMGFMTRARQHHAIERAGSGLRQVQLPMRLNR